VQSINRAGRRVRRSLGLLSAGTLVLTMAPAAVAGAQVPGTGNDTDDVPEARDIDEVCEAPYTSTFDDVTEGQSHWEAILCAADYGVTQGTSDPDYYNPGGTVNRAQMASFIVRAVETATAHELPAHDAGFTDVRSTSAHAENINKLAGVGITQGTSDDTYSPGNNVTRGQMASFIARAVDYIDDAESNGSLPPETDDDYFSDDDGTRHEDNINLVASVGIVQGFPDGDFRPGAEVRRDQMASFLMRSLDYVAVEGFLRATGSYVTNLDTGATFTTLSAALDAVAEDETLETQGTFTAGGTIDVDGVTVTSNPFGPTDLAGSFEIDADDVTIAGFHITDYAANPDNAGIYVRGGEGILIWGNHLHGSDGAPAASGMFGFSTAPGSGAVVEIIGNVFQDNNLGVYANNTADLTVEDNVFSGNNYSVGLDTETWTVSGNEFLDARQVGVELFQYTLGSTVTGNTFGEGHDAYICAPNPLIFAVAATFANDYEAGSEPNEDGTCLVPPADDDADDS
jgi:parallel beta-helix repeat protein